VARPGMMEHRKFVRLVAMLGLPRAHVRGLLECLWDVAYQCGQEYLGDVVDVELAAGWSGEAGRLCKALVECGGNGAVGFIEPVTDRDGHPSQSASGDPGIGFKGGSAVTDGPVRYRVHDLFDHAPEYVTGRAQREEERRKIKQCDRCKNAYHSPDQRSKFCSPACRTAAWRERHEKGVTDCDGEIRHGDGSLRSVTPRDGTPAPAPAPKRQDKDRDASAAPGGAGGSPPELELTPPDGKTAPRGQAGRRRDRVANPDLPKLIRHYETEFERTQGATPLIQEADGIAAARVLRGRTYDQAAALVTKFLEQPDKWTKSHGLLRLRDLPAAVTRILARASPSGRPAPGGEGRDFSDVKDDFVIGEDDGGTDQVQPHTTR